MNGMSKWRILQDVVKLWARWTHEIVIFDNVNCKIARPKNILRPISHQSPLIRTHMCRLYSNLIIIIIIIQNLLHNDWCVYHNADLSFTILYSKNPAPHPQLLSNPNRTNNNMTTTPNTQVVHGWFVIFFTRSLYHRWMRIERCSHGFYYFHECVSSQTHDILPFPAYKYTRNLIISPPIWDRFCIMIL